MALDDEDIFAAIFAKYSNQPIEYVMAEYEKAKRLNMEIEKRLMEQAEPVAPVKPVAAPVKQVTLIPEIEKKPVPQKKQYTQADLKFAPATAITDKSITCCLCGKQALTLTARHLAHHEISVEDYKKLCGYEPTQKLMAPDVPRKPEQRSVWKKRGRKDKLLKEPGWDDQSGSFSDGLVYQSSASLA